jgi:hypothetical protein
MILSFQDGAKRIGASQALGNVQLAQVACRLGGLSSAAGLDANGNHAAATYAAALFCCASGGRRCVL